MFDVFIYFCLVLTMLKNTTEIIEKTEDLFGNSVILFQKGLAQKLNFFRGSKKNVFKNWIYL